MHRDERVWGADAGEFRPQRWRQWQAQAGQAGFMQLLSGLGPNASYLPFGAGPRCGGASFGGVWPDRATASASSRACPHRATINTQTHACRNCIGTGFAMMEAILVLASILQRFDLRPAAPGLFPTPRPQITLRPDEVQLKLQLRAHV